MLPPWRRVGVKCFGLDEPALVKGEVWYISVGVLITVCSLSL